MPSADALSVVGRRTVLDVLTAGAARHPERELLVHDEIDRGVATYSWRDVLDRSWTMADRLRAEGVGQGDRVHLHLGNRPEFLFAWFACAALGAAMVPTNVQSSPHEIAYAIAHSRAVVSLTDAAGIEVVTRATELARGTPIIDVGASAASQRIGPRASCATPEADLGLLYTSGTTSRPKAVRVTHANYVYAGEVVARNLRLGPADRVMTVLPLFHANAQYYTTMGAIVAGATIVLISRFSASRLLDQAVEHEVTVASLFAAPIRMVLAQPPKDRWRRHRLRVVMFGQSLTPDEHARWDRAVGAPLLQLYGMTETIGPPLMNPLEGGRPETVGRPSLGYVCRVVREDGHPAGVGEVGNLLVGGVPGISLMRGYLDDPAATAATLRDGWLHTGDVVRVEDGGFLTFVDRRKDMIKRAGENVAASEVENALLEHPDVREAAVFGVPDRLRDERIVAAVVLRAGADVTPEQLIAWCADRLARFRVPSAVELIDELPRTAVGKVQKHVLSAAWREQQGVPAASDPPPRSEHL